MWWARGVASTPAVTEDETDEVWELVFEATKAHNARIQIVCRSARVPSMTGATGPRHEMVNTPLLLFELTDAFVCREKGHAACSVDCAQWQFQ